MENEPKFDIAKVIVNNKPKTIIIAVVVVLVIVMGVGFWFWSKSKQAPSLQEAPSLGSEIFDKTQNPLRGRVPDANPFKTVSNPFKKETNPIRAIYTNPFGEQ